MGKRIKISAAVVAASLIAITGSSFASASQANSSTLTRFITSPRPFLYENGAKLASDGARPTLATDSAPQSASGADKGNLAFTTGAIPATIAPIMDPSMNTKIKDGAIPVSTAILEAAHITEDTPLDVSVNGEGRLVVQASDTVEKVIDEYAGAY